SSSLVITQASLPFPTRRSSDLGLMADPDIQIRGTALPYGRGAAHGVYASNRKLAFWRFLYRHSTIQFQFVQVVALSFIRRVKANAFGNVTIKVTRHQRMVIVQ